MALTQIDDRGLKTPIDLLDNEKIRLGTGNDLEIYHDGSNSYLTNDTGILNIQGGGANIQLQAVDGESGLIVKADDAVELYYNGSKKIETTSSGVTVTGTLEATTYVAVPDQIYHVGDADTTIRFPAADTIALETAGSERMRIDSSGNVGIGTASPTGKLSIASGTFQSTTPTSTGDDIVISGNQSLGIQFLTLASGTSNNNIYFGDTDDPDIGMIRYAHADNSLQFRTNASERMRITSAGRLGIGITSPDRVLHVQASTAKTNSIEHVLQLNHISSGTTTTGFGTGIRFAGERNNGVLQVIGDLNLEADVNSGTNISCAMVFKPSVSGSATERMRITSAGNVGIGTTAPGEKLHVAGNIINTENIGSTGDSGIMIGTGHRLGFDQSGTRSWTVKAQDGVLNIASGDGASAPRAAGLLFGSDTAAANTLDDYEEGTWTPSAVITHQGGSGSVSSHNVTGLYTKIGRQVTCHVAIGINASSISGCNVGLDGLPFTISSSSVNFNVGVARRGIVGGEMFVFEGAQHNTTRIEVMRMYNNLGLSNGNQSIKGTFTYTAAT